MSKWFKKDVHVSDSEDDESEDVYSSYDEESEEEEEEEPRRGASKWFKGTADSEESDFSEEESDVSDLDDEDSGAPAAGRAAVSRISRYMLADDDDDDDGRRVVKSQKARRAEDLREQIERIDDVRKANNWREAQGAFLDLNKALDRFLKVHDKVPNMYVRCIAALEAAASKAARDKTARARMAAPDSKALGPILSRIRKNNAEYKSLLSDYAKNPELFDDDDDLEDLEDFGDEDEEEERVSAPPRTATPSERASKWFRADGDDSSDESDSDFDDSDFDGDESDSDDDSGDRRGKFWLKKSDAHDERKPKGKKGKRTAKRAPTAQKRKVHVERLVAQPKAKSLEELDWTADLIDEHLTKIRQSKGKRGVDARDQYDHLKILYKNSRLPGKQIEILLLMISVSFDIGSSHSMPVQVWNNNYLNFLRILHIIDGLPDGTEIVEHEETTPLLATVASTEADKDGADSADSKKLRIVGNMVTIFERLDDEFTKSLQSMDPHMHKYVQRLNDECMLMDLSERLFVYYSLQGDMERATRVAIRIFNRVYYRKQEEHVLILRKQREQIAQILAEGDFSFQPRDPVITEDLESMLKSFSSLIYKHSKSDTDKTRVLLLLIYHSAITGKFYEARDMLLMSRIQDTIYQADIPLQVLYNRAIAQLGLCAFRCGMIHEAHACLQDLVSSPKTRDLLAQNLVSQRQLAKMTVAERLEYDRTIPYHMHINVAKLEAVHLICAMMLEIPSMAQTGQMSRQVGGLRRRKVISKPLRKLLESFDRQVFLGPPDSTKSYIYAASKVLMRGDWSGCYDLLTKLGVWDIVCDTDDLKAMLKEKIKVEALRTYLFQFSKHYNRISLQSLSTMFELPESRVHSIVSKMIINDELFAAWDQPTQTIIIDRTAELSHLQQLALQLAERTNSFVEHNEKVFDAKAGTVEYAYASSTDRRKTATVGSSDRRHTTSSRRQAQQQQQQQGRRQQQQQQSARQQRHQQSAQAKQ